ncbi:unnamed protein product [Protopolystoma xenopodis]|uniref:Uncharacterized protein n=1 Tax=Protopolystoma xenopodis TaxID=117903 RepID=A0A448XN36_9PLAT|nr:unnamed protein product [Protopolystoma xenopodis]
MPAATSAPCGVFLPNFSGSLTSSTPSPSDASSLANLDGFGAGAVCNDVCETQEAESNQLISSVNWSLLTSAGYPQLHMGSSKSISPHLEGLLLHKSCWDKPALVRIDCQWQF